MKKNVLYLDCWSDHNRGDAAMQLGVIRLIRSQSPGAHVTVMAAYGSNQANHLHGVMNETAGAADRVVGGFRTTFVPFDGESPYANGTVRRARTAASVLAMPLRYWLLTLALQFPILKALFRESTRESLEAVRSADVVIWNGRNFRSDSKSREPYEFLQLLFNPALILRANKTVTAVGVSIWPLKSRLAERMLSRTLIKCAHVTARERESYDRLGQLVRVSQDETGVSIHLLPDLSLAAIGEHSSRLIKDNLRRENDQQAPPLRFAMTTVDWPNSGSTVRDRYVSTLKEFISCRLEEDPRVTFTLIPQVTVELESTERIFNALVSVDPKRVIVDRDLTSVESLVNSYAKYDLLIATRMHSAIFATCAGTPVVTIPYDKGGKWGILDMLGQRDVAINYDEVSCSQLSAKVDAAWAARKYTQRRVHKNLPALLTDVENHVRLALGNPAE